MDILKYGFGGLFFLTGCASVETLSGPDGTVHHLVHCSEVRLCYEKALQVCNGPYEIVNTSTRVSGAPHGWTTSEQQLLIKCQTERKSSDPTSRSLNK